MSSSVFDGVPGAITGERGIAHFGDPFREQRRLATGTALAPLDDRHAELKSMRTASHRLRQGIAGRLVRFVLDEARAAGFTRVSLETGSEDFFAPAHALYARHGFDVCPPFGRYRPDPQCRQRCQRHRLGDTRTRELRTGHGR